MNEFAVSRDEGDGWADPSIPAQGDRGGSRLRVIKSAGPDVEGGRASRSYVSISVDVDGHIDFESEVEPQYADRMTDVLLLVLLKAREARKRS